MPKAAPEAGAEGPVRPARTNAAGSARLQHMPITLKPEARKQSSRATSDETEALIYEHYVTSLARSPHQRDAMSRRVAQHVWEKEQALILTETCAALVSQTLTLTIAQTLTLTQTQTLIHLTLPRTRMRTLTRTL